MWLSILFATLTLSIIASVFAGYGQMAFFVLIVIFIVCSTPALLFLKKPIGKNAKMIEYASALWTIGMYLTLGGGPMLSKLNFSE